MTDKTQKTFLSSQWVIEDVTREIRKILGDEWKGKQYTKTLWDTA